MAIGFARLEFVKRSSGKNMVTKSAYNGKIRLEFDGNCVANSSIYDWTGPGRGERPISHAILLPEHVDKRFYDPQELWNYAEKVEKRKDSQVGLEMLLALPDDKLISDEQRTEMAHAFAKKYFVAKGYGVQVDVHRPSQRKSYVEVDGDKEKNEKNFHAHILITTRHFNEDGTGFNDKKVNDLNPEIRGNKRYAFGGIEWTKLWTQFQNEYFEGKGLDLRVDQPGAISQIHLGPVRMRGKRSGEILDLQNSREELGQLLSQDPEHMLQRLTENKSVFTESDVEIFLQKNIPENEIEQVRELFWKNPQIVQLFDKELYQAIPKFSAAEVIEEERKILRLADRIHQKLGHSTKNEPVPSHLNNEQSVAFDKSIKENSLICIEGLAGSGKSYLLVALKDRYEANGYRVRAFGPDNATVKVLQEKGFKDVKNIHQFLFKDHFSKKKSISDKEVWIIDEASKIGNRPLLELLKSAERNDVKVIFSGNSAQLSSVERGGMFKALCDRYGYAFLGEIQRQNSQVDRDISKRLAHGDVASAVSMIANTGGFIWSKNKDEAILRTVEKWAEDCINFPYSSNLIIAHTNKEVRQINDLVHTIRMARGEVAEKEFDCYTIFGNIRVSEGDLIEFRDNSKKLKVNNGERGILISASENQFVVALEEKTISFNPKKFTAFQLAYAATYFRSQGGTYDNLYITYNRNMNQKLLYVAMTRHRRKAHCFVSKTDASCLMDLKRQVSRKSEVENTLAYTTATEIEKQQKSQQREKSLQELCESDSLMSRTKGYSFKTWDYLKGGVGSFLEQLQDSKTDKNFYAFHGQGKEGAGRVVEIKEEKLVLSILRDKTGTVDTPKKNYSPRTNAFQKKTDEKKALYKNYFDKSENTSTLHAIVQSEAIASAVSKESTLGFSAWQKSCADRNKAAFELLRGDTQHKAVLGEKALQILQDRAGRYEQSIQSKDSIEAQLKENIDGVLYRLFPDGPQRRDSRGFRFGSKGSLLVTCIGEKKGCYYNFETQEGGNILQLIEKKLGLNRSEAISWGHDFLKNFGEKSVPSHFSTKSFVKSREENWICLMPPSNAPIPQLNILSRYLESNYKLTASYLYHDADGSPVFYTLRLEHKEDGKKIVLPLSYGKTQQQDEPSWKLKSHSAKSKLLYNTHLVCQQSNKPVLIVEGEKTADAAQKLLGKDYVVVSWIGGAAAAKEANWKLLFGRDVVIWPDNDSAGFKASADISRALRQVGVNSLKVIGSEMLKDLPLKWDLADALPVEKTPHFISDCLLRAESKAISMDRLMSVASQHGLTFQQLNEVVCDIDDRMRIELEKKHGLKTWEIETSILSETNKVIKEKSLQMVSNSKSTNEQTIQKERNNRSIDLTHER